MKKLFTAILCILLLTVLSPITALADTAVPYTTDSIITIESAAKLPDTTITPPSMVSVFLVSGTAPLDFEPAGIQTITATKTTTMRDSNQNVLWYVSVTATFSYNGSSAWCTGCSHDAQSSSGIWTIKSSSHSSSGNSATATATAVKTNIIGIPQEHTKSVTISCSPTGEIS